MKTEEHIFILDWIAGCYLRLERHGSQVVFS